MEQSPENKNFTSDFHFEKPEPEEKKEGEIRSEEKQQELEREIALIARIFSRQYDMDVLPADKWACGLDPEANESVEKYFNGEIPDIQTMADEVFKPTIITYKKSSLEEEDKEVVIGKVRHEVGHAKNTDYRLLVEGMKFAKDQGYLTTSWANIANALEDPWVNNLESGESETARQKIAALYEHWKKETTEFIGTQPVTRQLMLNIIHYWLTGEGIPTLKNKEVQKVFEEIKPKLDQVFKGESAKANFDTIKKDIWDKYKVLEQKAAEDEELKKIMESADPGLMKKLRGGEGAGEGGEGEEGGEGLLSKIRKKLGGGGESKQGKELSSELPKHVGSGTRKKIQDALKKQVEERKQQSEAKEEKKEGVPADLEKDVDLDKLPDELKDEIRSIIKGLPKELKKKLADEARSQLDNKQAKALNKELPKFIKMKKDKKTGQYIPEFQTENEGELKDKKKEVDEMVKGMEKEETEQWEKEMKEIEEQRRREREEAEKLREIKEMADYGFTAEEKGDYLKFKQLENSMRSQVENFLKILDKYLPKKEEYKYTGEYFIGKKPDFKKLPKKIPIKRYDIFRRREIQESSEPKLYVTLLIDNSGSMSGEKMEESLKTAIFFARVLKRFDIPFAIKFFGDHVEPVKDFEDEYDNPSKRIKPKLVQLADASGGSTNISAPLETTEQEMIKAKRKFPGSHGAIFVISDGGANRGRVGDQLKKYVEELQKTYMVNAFGLGSGAAQELKGYFGDLNTGKADDFKDLPAEAFKVLRVTLERILKRLRKV